MKKFTLTIAALFAAVTLNAQDDCANALPVTGGNTYTVTAIDGDAPTEACFTNSQTGDPLIADNGEWYSYTVGSDDELVTVTTDLPANTGGDTRLSIYSGNCTALSCLTTADDVNYVGENDPNNNLLSTVNFVAEAGETYYIAFDSYWEATGFDFEVTTSTDIPEVPGVATNPTPTDGATDVVLNNSGQTNDDGDPLYGYTFSWDAPTTGEDIEYIFLIGVTPDISSMQPISASDPSTNSIGIVGLQINTQYYWAVYPSNIVGGPELSDLPVWSFTTSSELSIDDLKQKQFTHYIGNGQLTLEANSSLESVVLYDILGKQVASEKLSNNKESINVSNLQAGVYLAQVKIEGKIKTFKFVKK